MSHNKTEFNIRSAKSEDNEQIAELAEILAEQDGENSNTTKETLLRDVFSDNPECSIIVAESSQNNIIGFVMYYSGYDLASASSGYHMGDIIISKKFRRKGIARKLVQRLAKEALNNKKQWISWTVGQKNEGAKSFYKNSVNAAQVDVDFMALGKTGLVRLTEMA